MIVGGERYPKEIRAEAIRLYAGGLSAAVAADHLGLKAFTVKGWVSVGEALLLAWAGETFTLSSSPIWVRDVAVALSVKPQELLQ
jgi:transposase-like protein